MLGERNIPVLTAFSLNNMQYFPIEIEVLKLNVSDFHAPQSAAVNKTDEEFVFQQFGILKHAPDLFAAQNHGQFFDFWNGGKMQVAVGQTFGFQQKTQAVNGMFKVRLRRGLASLLEFVEIIFNLLRIQFSRQSFKMQGQGGNVSRVIVESTFASAQDGNISFEALQEFGKTVNFARGTIQDFVRS